MVERIVGIVGPMFSGKTLEIRRIAEREVIAGRKVQIFKPLIDNRGEGLDVIKSRFGGEWEATSVENPKAILENLRDGINTVIVDEVQFFGQKDDEGCFEIVKVLKRLVDDDIRVVFAGLPRDFRGEPFGPMGELLARAQEYIPVTAVCDYVDSNGNICGKPATETQRFVDGELAGLNNPTILVGDTEFYAPRCIGHHKVPNRPKYNEK